MDLVRFSDGRISPENLVADQIQLWLEGSAEYSEHVWGDRTVEVAEIYAPDVYQRWLAEDRDGVDALRLEHRPLIWKEVSIPAGSEVRMSYGGKIHFAKIKRGRIVDEDGEFSPSEWASKVADGTSRNAWRDLWFCEPNTKNWVSAQSLRKRPV